MKIVHVAPPEQKTPPDKYGGIERVVSWLAEAQAELGHEVHLVAPEGSATQGGTLHLVPLGCSQEEITRQALEVVSEVTPDVIHDHNNSQLVFQQRPDLPVVGTQHNKTMFRHPWMVKNCHAEARRLGGGPVVHYGMDLSEYPYAAERGKELLYLGAMHPRKQVHHVMDAAKSLGMPLCVAGPDRHPEYFATEIKPRLGGQIRWLDAVGGQEKLDLLQGMRALVLPSKWESFGIVLTEAMSCGKPVVAWDNGPARELIKQGVTGYVYRWKCGLRAALKRVDDLRGEDCRSHVEEHFTARRMAEDYLRVYRDRIAAGSGS